MCQIRTLITLFRGANPARGNYDDSGVVPFAGVCCIRDDDQFPVLVGQVQNVRDGLPDIVINCLDGNDDAEPGRHTGFTAFRFWSG